MINMDFFSTCDILAIVKTNPISLVIVIICDLDIGDIAAATQIYLEDIECDPPFLCVSMINDGDVWTQCR